MNIKHLNQIGDKVIVKKGEGGGGSASGSTMEYFVYDKDNFHSMSLSQSIANYFKFLGVDGKAIAPYTPLLKSTIEQQGNEIIAFGVPMGSKMKMQQGDMVIDMTLREYILSMGGISEEELASIPRLTEEEFYTL